MLAAGSTLRTSQRLRGHLQSLTALGCRDIHVFLLKLFSKPLPYQSLPAKDQINKPE
jgi:hypothetical protein